MTEQDWNNIALLQRLASNYSTPVGVSLQKLVYEFGKLMGEKSVTK